MDLGRIMGVGRVGLLIGVGMVTVGTIVDVASLAWVGVGIAGLSLVVNSAGKVAYYGRLDVPAVRRGLVVGAWVAIALGIFGLVVDYTYSRLHPGYEGYFWAIAIGVVGAALVYQGFRSKFVPDTAPGE